jgi:hypothetical protein
MSVEYPVGTKVMTFSWSPLMKVLGGPYGIVAKYDPKTDTYELHAIAKGTKEYVFSVRSTEFKLADSDFPDNGTTKAIFDALGIRKGGRRRNRKSTKKARRNNRRYSRRN